MNGSELRRGAMEPDDIPRAVMGYDRGTIRMLLHRFAESYDLVLRQRDEAQERATALEHELRAARNSATTATAEIARMVTVSLDAQLACHRAQARFDRLDLGLDGDSPGDETVAGREVDGGQARRQHRSFEAESRVGSGL